MPAKTILIFLVLETILIGSHATSQTPPINKEDINNADAMRQTQIRIAREIEELIPGEYEANSDQSKKVAEIAEYFVGGKDAKGRAAIMELIDLDPNVPPRDLLVAGIAFALNNSMQGMSVLEKAAVNVPDHPSISLAFARIALLQGRFFDAITLSEKSQKINAESDLSAEAKEFYELGCLDIKTFAELRRSNILAAEKVAAEWEQKDPDDDKMLLAAAEIQFLMQRLDPTVEFLNRRSESTQQQLPTEIVVAKWLLNKNDLPRYTDWLKEAYKKHPQTPIVQLEYAAWMLRKEDFANAEKLIEEYEQQNGSSNESDLIRGRIAFSRQDYATAEQLFERLYRVAPNNFENAYLYVLTLLESNDESKKNRAVPIAQQIFQSNPTNQLAVATLGWALWQNGKQEMGGDFLNRASRMGQMLPDTAFFLAQMMLQQDRKFQAKRLLDPFIATPEIFIFRGRAKAILTTIAAEGALPDPVDD